MTNEKTTNSKNDIIKQREKYYRRNYIALMFEGFFVSFAFSIFSHTTVFPVYVSYITENSFFISLVSVIYFGLSYFSSILSCVWGVNAKSPKWISIIICGTQRIGFIAIIISTYFAFSNSAVALTIFFLSFAVYAVAAGMSSPVFYNMVATVIPKKIGGFMGSYSLIGAASGVISSRIMTKILDKYGFPVNYRTIFIIGTVMAVIATFIVVFGVKEVVGEEEKEKIKFSDLPAIVKGLFTKNIPYRRFLITRIILGIAEMTIPFYIIKVGKLEGVTAGFVGTMTTVLLISNMIAGKFMGYIGDKLGPMAMVLIGSVSGVLAAGLALLMPGYQFGYLLFILVSFAQQGITLSTNVAGIYYSDGGHIPILVATTGLVSAPLYIVSSLAGGVLAEKYSIDLVFIIGVFSYLCVAILSYIYFKNSNKNVIIKN
ncbi:MFS transporter [Herbinix hemicellulosilytica]|uniref:Putative membrane protein n=1 Tax=Herbinix hemicellulosilytica TaxID=1564487 RepID=A0A0H5SHS7_HERHM|nr:MFS transporter [Herbinix hemicellulosilytica]RBP58521.1 MFS transporter [Herbinix hemicellulosilytica]CRZ35014.1 putative membrane protein [Herbinix hemicellulosilytica]